MKPNSVILVSDEEICASAKNKQKTNAKTIKAETDTTIKSAFLCLRTVCLTIPLVW